MILIVNGRLINEVIIDPHYEKKHKESISDELILKLVRQLSGRKFPPNNVKENFSYFVYDMLMLEQKKYKIVWVLENEKTYLGVINAYRRK
jgi:hypothetical protein